MQQNNTDPIRRPPVICCPECGRIALYDEEGESFPCDRCGILWRWRCKTGKLEDIEVVQVADDSATKFKVGDCIILNDCERPSGQMVCVVTGVAKGALGHHHVQYLNADPRFDVFSEPPMASMLKRATKLKDFGVVIRTDGTSYWCEKREESKATYPDGRPRKWQEWDGPVKYKPRQDVAALVWPF
jgi:predicted RNA-binding Zn-ribbon protein involved in translation (DUF1610 family)